MPVLKLIPAYKDYVWGGTKLISDFNKAYNGKIIAESWELSTHCDGLSMISCGGTDTISTISFASYIEKHPESVGTNCINKVFPILIKLIDANKALSIQVHPNDEYARKYENSAGKTEMWIVLDCNPNSYIYYGFKQKITRSEFISRINNNTLTEVLRKISVKKESVYYIPAGTIHALSEGLIIAEIQQSSNLTYRVYDYNRKDANGNLRQLHIEKAADVINFDFTDSTPPGMSGWVKEKDFHYRVLTKNNFFTSEQLKLDGIYIKTITTSSFMSVLCTDGYCSINDGQNILEANKGDSFFVSAGNYDVQINGKGNFILTSV